MTRSDLDNNGAQKVPKCQCYQLSGVQVQGCGSKVMVMLLLLMMMIEVVVVVSKGVGAS